MNGVCVSSRRFRRSRRRTPRGFTLIEIMIGVAMFAVFLGVATQAFTSYRQRTSATSCVANLAAIEAAKREWALANRKADNATCSITNDLVGAGRYLPAQPLCPSGGIYAPGTLAASPTCSIDDNGTTRNTADDHRLRAMADPTP